MKKCTQATRTHHSARRSADHAARPMPKAMRGAVPRQMIIYNSVLGERRPYGESSWGQRSTESGWWPPNGVGCTRLVEGGRFFGAVMRPRDWHAGREVRAGGAPFDESLAAVCLTLRTISAATKDATASIGKAKIAAWRCARTVAGASIFFECGVSRNASAVKDWGSIVGGSDGVVA